MESTNVTEVVELLLSNGANPNASDNIPNLTPLEMIEAIDSAAAERAKTYAGAGGLVGPFAGLHTMRHLREEYRKRATPVVALLEQARRDWSLLDTLRYKLK